MKKLLFFLLPLLGAATAHAEAPLKGWGDVEVQRLLHWVKAAPAEGLPELPVVSLEGAVSSGSQAAIDQAATTLALQLARMHLLGAAAQSERANWEIADTDDASALRGQLAGALAADTLDRFFEDLRPGHPDYAALRAAYATEANPEKRLLIARNLERWRWLPLSLGENYLLVNAAGFDVRLWRGGSLAGRWPVIVGKVSTPTPVFKATVTGITFNPWWEIPTSIERATVADEVQADPVAARKKGYVWTGGRYRQRPGPENALGHLKLIMPNAHNVYLHDSPHAQLFSREVRVFSAGCIRVQDAEGFAATLLQGVRTREALDAMIATGQTRSVALRMKLPVYITYFTAAPDRNGKVVFKPDIYDRDSRIGLASHSSDLSGSG